MSTIEIHLPTMRHPGLIPAGEWPDLDEVRADQQRLAAALADAERRVRQLKMERADERRHDDERRVAAVTAGEPLPDATGRTDAEWDAEIQRAERDVEAVRAALGRFQDVLAGTIQRHGGVWLRDLHVRADAVRERQAEARRLLAEAEADEERLRRLGRWVRRWQSGEAAVAEP